MAAKLLAWHFLKKDGCLRYPPYTKVEVGQTLEAEPPLLLCHRGLHASIWALDALRYAPGPIVCRVEVWGDRIMASDKLCAQYRRVLWMADATKVLHLAALAEIEASLARHGVDDDELKAVIAVKRRWVEGVGSFEDVFRALKGPIAIYEPWRESLDSPAPVLALFRACCGARYRLPRSCSVSAALTEQNRRIEAALRALAPPECAE